MHKKAETRAGNVFVYMVDQMRDALYLWAVSEAEPSSLHMTLWASNEFSFWSYKAKQVTVNCQLSEWVRGSDPSQGS